MSASPRIAVMGAAGRMGRTLVAAAEQQADARLAAGIVAEGSSLVGADLGELAGLGKLGVVATTSLEKVADEDYLAERA